MDRKKKIIIVTAFGRGYFLAEQLAKSGCNVTVVDTSNQLGDSTHQDFEGPFSVHRPIEMDDRMWDHFSDLFEAEEQTNGLSLWLETGPLELKSPMTEFGLLKYGINPQISTQLAAHSDFSKKISGSYKNTWLYGFAHQLYSTVYKQNSKASSWGAPQRIFGPCFTHKLKSLGEEKLFGRMRDCGVRVYPDSKIVDVSVVNKKIEGVEIASTFKGVITGDLHLWCLSLDETRHLNPKVAKLFFRGEKAFPSWQWVRSELQIDDGPELQALPNYFVMIQDKRLPWTGQNVMVCRRRFAYNVFDLWMRVPYDTTLLQLELIYASASDFMKRKLPEEKIKLTPNMSPQNPARFPVFLEKDWGVREGMSYKNIIFDGPENWTSYGIPDRYIREMKMKHKVQIWFDSKGRYEGDIQIQSPRNEKDLGPAKSL